MIGCNRHLGALKNTKTSSRIEGLKDLPHILYVVKNYTVIWITWPHDPSGKNSKWWRPRICSSSKFSFPFLRRGWADSYQIWFADAEWHPLVESVAKIIIFLQKQDGSSRRLVFWETWLYLRLGRTHFSQILQQMYNIIAQNRSRDQKHRLTKIQDSSGCQLEKLTNI